LRSENYSRNEGDTACSETSGQERASMSSEGLSELGRRILGQLKVDTAIHIDEILEKEEHSTSSELIATLFELEMLGLVRQLPGKNFVKVW
jgi:hypothetical protein